MADPVLPIDLGDGLRLRSATPADAETLATFNGEMHTNDPAEPDQSSANWTRDLLTRPHPTFRPDLFTIVDEPATGRIVSSLNLIPQTWSFGGIEIGVGRIELVGTHPDFRSRGLAGRQMEVAHRWSVAMGHLMQGITGIPWYYRRFGYEMALDLGGSWRLPIADVAPLAEGVSEPYSLRPATLDDIKFLVAADSHGRQRWLLSCVRDQASWRYELAGKSIGAGGRVLVSIMEESAGSALPVGFTVHDPSLRQETLWVLACELAPERSWLAVVPSVLRALKAEGERITVEATPSSEPVSRFERISLDLGADHPLGRLAVATERRPPYAWFIRVPDLAAFVRRVRSVLEARLAASPVANFSGDLRLGFYGDGLRLRFEAGKLADVANTPEPNYRVATSFPPLTFLHLLCGHRSLSEIEHAHADCRVLDLPSRVLIEALFPPRPSSVWPLD